MAVDNRGHKEIKHLFFPHHVLKQLIQILLIIFILVTLATFLPASLESKADPFTTPEHIKPEWYFLATYQWLKLAEKLSFMGAWAPKAIGVFGPGIALLFILILPFIDRYRERHPLRRPISVAAGIALGIIFIGLTIWGYYS